MHKPKMYLFTIEAQLNYKSMKSGYLSYQGIFVIYTRVITNPKNLLHCIF